MKRKILFILLVLAVSVSMTAFAQLGSSRSYRAGDTGPGGGTIGYYTLNGKVYYFEFSKDLGQYNWDDAMRAVSNYKGGGLSDWKLPGIGILQAINNCEVQHWPWKILANGYWSYSQATTDGDYPPLNPSNPFGTRTDYAFYKLAEIHTNYYGPKSESRNVIAIRELN